MEKVLGESSTSSQQIQVPSGYHFEPHDWELIMHYVKNKNSGCPLPVEIPEEDINSRHPKRLKGTGFGDSTDDYDKEYYFTQRTLRDQNRVNRTCSTGEGYWKNTSKDIPIEDENKKITGYKRTFTFFEGKDKPTHWIMHEFRDLKEKCSTIDRHVLCMIYERRKKGLPSPAKNTGITGAIEEVGESPNSQNQFHRTTEEWNLTDFGNGTDFSTSHNYQQPDRTITEGSSSNPTESVHNYSGLWGYQENSSDDDNPLRHWYEPNENDSQLF